MISQAIALSIVTFVGFFIIFTKLPPKLKLFVQTHDLLTDITCLGLGYILLGGTLVALLSAALCGLFVSAALYVNKNQSDFLYLWDIADMIKQRIGDVKKALLQFGHEYRVKKAEQNAHQEIQNA